MYNVGITQESKHWPVILWFSNKEVCPSNLREVFVVSCLIGVYPSGRLNIVQYAFSVGFSQRGLWRAPMPSLLKTLNKKMFFSVFFTTVLLL